MPDPFDAEAWALEYMGSGTPLAKMFQHIYDTGRREAIEEAAAAGDVVVDAYERAACAAPTKEVRDLQTNRMLGASNAVREIRALTPEGVARGLNTPERLTADESERLDELVEATRPSEPLRGALGQAAPETPADSDEEAGHTPASRDALALAVCDLIDCRTDPCRGPAEEQAMWDFVAVLARWGVKDDEGSEG